MSRIENTIAALGIFLLPVVAVGLLACSSVAPAPTPTSPPPTPTATPEPEGWVEFTFPPAEAQIPNPVVIEGQAGPGARSVRLQIRGPEGELLGEHLVTFSEPRDSPRGFSVQVSYETLGQIRPGVIHAFFNEGAAPAGELRVVLSPQ